jgi:hypothetical protein
MRPNPAVLEPGHISGFRRCLERFQGIPYFPDFSIAGVVIRNQARSYRQLRKP